MSKITLSFLGGSLLVLIGGYILLTQNSWSSSKYDYLSRTSKADWERLFQTKNGSSALVVSVGEFISGNGKVPTQQVVVTMPDLKGFSEFPVMGTLRVSSVKSNFGRELFNAAKEVNKDFFQRLKFRQTERGVFTASNILWLEPMDPGEKVVGISGKVEFLLPLDVKKFEFSKGSEGYIRCENLVLKFLGIKQQEADLIFDDTQCKEEKIIASDRFGCLDLSFIDQVIGIGPMGEVVTFKRMSASNNYLTYRFDRPITRITFFVANKRENLELPFKLSNE